jgi:hypothetical protein
MPSVAFSNKEVMCDLSLSMKVYNCFTCSTNRQIKITRNTEYRCLVMFTGVIGMSGSAIRKPIISTTEITVAIMVDFLPCTNKESTMTSIKPV